METSEVQRWMHEHPDSVHGALDTVIGHCTRDIRKQAARAAWIEARQILRQEHLRWRNAHGNHASPGFVAREVCSGIASKLSQMEPMVPVGGEDHILDRETRESLEPDALEKIRPWLHDLAVRAEHDEWLQIVQFTKHRGASIAREENLSSDPHWRTTREYGAAAAFVTRVLLRDYAMHTAKHTPKHAANPMPNPSAMHAH